MKFRFFKVLFLVALILFSSFSSRLEDNEVVSSVSTIDSLDSIQDAIDSYINFRDIGFSKSEFFITKTSEQMGRVSLKSQTLIFYSIYCRIFLQPEKYSLPPPRFL